jgi:glycine cleavage system H protein
MSLIPSELLYTAEHEWVCVHDDNTVTIGITDYAQESLGDITFVEFPDVGAVLTKGETFGVVESVKAASDLYMPLDGEILEINEQVDDEPELLNQAPFEGGWLLKVRIQDANQLAVLLTPQAYTELI